MLSSLARSASRFQNRLVQTAVDPFTDRIVCRVTKISPARVASALQSTNKPVSYLGPLERFCPDRIVYIDQSKSTGNVFTNLYLTQRKPITSIDLVTHLAFSEANLFPDCQAMNEICDEISSAEPCKYVMFSFILSFLKGGLWSVIWTQKLRVLKVV